MCLWNRMIRAHILQQVNGCAPRHRVALLYLLSHTSARSRRRPTSFGHPRCFPSRVAGHSGCWMDEDGRQACKDRATHFVRAFRSPIARAKWACDCWSARVGAQFRKTTHCLGERCGIVINESQHVPGWSVAVEVARNPCQLPAIAPSSIDDEWFHLAVCDIV